MENMLKMVGLKNNNNNKAYQKPLNFLKPPKRKSKYFYLQMLGKWSS